MERQLRIGVLETGRLAPELEARHGRYGLMFERLLRQDALDAAYDVFPVVDGVFPEAVDACDAWIVTGSKHGVYDDLPWIEPLKTFLRDAYRAQVPLVGVCFGHQIMAEALGGRAEKSPKGWGVGARVYHAIPQDSAWFGAIDSAVLTLHAMHQDQVTRVPPGARTIAGSEFCPIAALAYGDGETPRAISIQPHPEFDARLIEDLIDLRDGVGIPRDVADEGRAGLGGAVNSEAIARWIGAFLAEAKASRAPAPSILTRAASGVTALLKRKRPAHRPGV